MPPNCSLESACNLRKTRRGTGPRLRSNRALTLSANPHLLTSSAGTNESCGSIVGDQLHRHLCFLFQPFAYDDTASMCVDDYRLVFPRKVGRIKASDHNRNLP